MARPTVTQRDYEVLAEFRAILRRFLAFSEDVARQAGLTPRQHQALLAMKGSPGRAPVNVGYLADQLHLQHHSAVELANRLVKAGLVIRLHDTSDRRRVWLRLTRKGEAQLGALSAIHLDELRQARPVLRRLVGRLARH